MKLFPLIFAKDAHRSKIKFLTDEVCIILEVLVSKLVHADEVAIFQIVSSGKKKLSITSLMVKMIFLLNYYS